MNQNPQPSVPRMVLKGHGTENDFLIISDPDGTLDITPRVVATLCDRRRALGGDGLIRIVRAGALGESLVEGVTPSMWFMDYRNADGSLAEMCGNGVRVFAHALKALGLEGATEFEIGTRAGVRRVTVLAANETDATVRVDMGVPRVLGETTVNTADGKLPALGVDMGNPHAAGVIPEADEQVLESFVLSSCSFDAAFFPAGVNIEVLTPPRMAGNELVVSMRVLERGVGETRSCGTGTVAAAMAALKHQGRSSGRVRVCVPGGEVHVEITPKTSYLEGPSRIVARCAVAEDLFG